MHITIEGIKKGFSIFWEYSIFLIGLNFFCFLALLPALLFYSVTVSETTLFIAVINIVLLLPAVFFVFALYAVLYDCRQSIALKFSTYFKYLRSTWKQALTFGVINMVFIGLVVWNLSFYAQFEAAWAVMMQYVFLSISLLWAILQIIMLPLYPRLENPQFKLALKNAGAIFASYLIPVIILVVWTGLFVVLTARFQFLGMLFSIALIAAFGEGVIGEIVIDIKGPQPESDGSEE